MKIMQTEIGGACVLKRELHTDERGFFTRIFCRSELEEAGLCADIVQANMSGNHKKGTLRGLHMQRSPFAEDKIVMCVSGEVFDVCVDVRKDSPTWGRWTGARLTEENGRALYIPKGCAHGYLTLKDNSRLLYMTTQAYTPSAEIGFRYDDPAFSVNWPLEPPYIVSEKDAGWPLLGAGSPVI